MKQCLLNLILFSGRRKDLLLLLKEKPRDIDSIKELLKVDASSVQPHIKKMKDSGLIIERNKIYSLSEIGEAIIENMQPLLNMAEFFGENAEYWMSHDLSSIPEFLLERIDELGRCELLEPDAEHLAETPKILMDNILNSKEILTLTTYFHPQAPLIYAELAEKGAEITLCMTENVAERLFLNYRKEAEKLSGATNSRLFVLRKPADDSVIDCNGQAPCTQTLRNQRKVKGPDSPVFRGKSSMLGKGTFQILSGSSRTSG